MRRGGGKIGTKSCKERHEAAAAAAALGVGCTSVLLSSFYRPILHHQHQHQVMNVSNISQTKIRVKEREGL